MYFHQTESVESMIFLSTLYKGEGAEETRVTLAVRPRKKKAPRRVRAASN